MFGPRWNDMPIVYARDSYAAIAFITTSWHLIQEIWFDHDLGGNDTSMRVVDFIDEKVFHNELAPEGRVYRIQSANPKGWADIRRALGRYDFEFRRDLPPVIGYLSHKED